MNWEQGTAAEPITATLNNIPFKVWSLSNDAAVNSSTGKASLDNEEMICYREDRSKSLISITQAGETYQCFPVFSCTLSNRFVRSTKVVRDIGLRLVPASVANCTLPRADHLQQHHRRHSEEQPRSTDVQGLAERKRSLRPPQRSSTRRRWPKQKVRHRRLLLYNLRLRHAGRLRLRHMVQLRFQDSRLHLRDAGEERGLQDQQ
jgi:hypothetical protein